ncbi:hypothetical protein [Halomarina rubra]|uniref:Uncharacterized protein n=1 Tax=Halomarina rubra TaxID=2071873 RepID=A0ABD6AVQ5_9EURY|nr:hypothetical protein [Halomarina rubra]
MTLLDSLRRPEHTGERRCWPCTLVNALVVAAVSLVLARRRRRLATLLAVVGGTLVWLRGYVVPYTPAFAPRLVAASPLPDAWFHRDRFDADAPDRHRTGSLGTPDSNGAALDGEAVLGALVEAGVVSVEEDGVDLDPAFAETWRAEMAPLAGRDTAALAAAVGETVPALTATVVEGLDGDWVVVSAGEDVTGPDDGEVWLSRPVAVAEVAAVRALDGRVPDAVARRAASPLRTFLTDCPDCGTPLRESTTASCCGGHTTPLSKPDPVLACPNCRVSLVVYES